MAWLGQTNGYIKASIQLPMKLPEMCRQVRPKLGCFLYHICPYVVMWSSPLLHRRQIASGLPQTVDARGSTHIIPTTHCGLSPLCRHQSPHKMLWLSLCCQTGPLMAPISNPVLSLMSEPFVSYFRPAIFPTAGGRTERDISGQRLRQSRELRHGAGLSLGQVLGIPVLRSSK